MQMGPEPRTAKGAFQGGTCVTVAPCWPVRGRQPSVPGAHLGVAHTSSSPMPPPTPRTLFGSPVGHQRPGSPGQS